MWSLKKACILLDCLCFMEDVQISSIRRGIVIRDKIVVVIIHREAQSASAPYLEANKALVLPAGIAVRIKDTPVSIGRDEKPGRRNGVQSGRRKRAFPKSGNMVYFFIASAQNKIEGGYELCT